MKNKIGVVSSTYAKFQTEEILDGISKAGFKYVELASAPSYFEHILPRPEFANKQDAADLVHLCESYGLELICIAGHTRMMKENDVENLKKVIDYAENAGVQFVTTDAGEVNNEEDMESFYQKMAELGKYSQEKNIMICLEMHGNWLNNGKTGAEAVTRINNPFVRLNYDTGNSMLYGKVKAEEDIINALPYMGFMHIKERPDVPEWNFPALGEGKLDFKKIFNFIQDYTGPISVEVEFTETTEPTLEGTNAAIKKSYEFLKSSGML